MFLSLTMIFSLFIGTGITAYAADTLTGPYTTNATWNDGDVAPAAMQINGTAANGFSVDNPLVITVNGTVTVNQLTINGSVKFTGGGKVIRSAGTNRLFHFSSSPTLILDDITIDGGSENGITATMPVFNMAGSNNKLIINEGAVIQNCYNSGNAPFYLGGGAKIEMNGGIIKNSSSAQVGSSGNIGVIQIQGSQSSAPSSFASFTMTGGTIDVPHVAIGVQNNRHNITFNPTSDISITGSIAPGGVYAKALTINPQEGYPIGSVIFDDEDPISGSDLGESFTRTDDPSRTSLVASSMKINMASGSGGTEAYAITSGLTAGDTSGTVTFEGTSTVEGDDGTSIVAAAGDEVTVLPQAASGNYIAQVRISTDEGVSYTAIDKIEDAYKFVMPEGAVDIQVDTAAIVWDGTIDLTWYDTEASTFNLQYPAQFAGLAAIVNGIFTTYPTTPGKAKNATNGQEVDADLPDYQKFKDGMGVVAPEEGSETPATSKLYGEFEATYQVSDTQIDYNTRSAPVTKTARVIGNPDFVQLNSDLGVEGGNNMVSADNFFYGMDDFNYKTVNVVADMNFGATKSGDRWDTSSPIYMPIGGQYCMLPGNEMTNAWTKIGSSFNGTLDGKGHSFTNVFAEYYANTAFGDSSTIGIVGRLGVHDNDPPAIRGYNPTVRQLVLESGYVAGRRSVGGIVGKIGKTTFNNGDGSIGGIVEFCVNKATVKSTDSKGLGGIVGASWNGGIVQYCANFGRIASTYSNPTGGVVGSNEIPVRNSYNVGTISAARDSYAMGIGTNNGGGADITDCYWLTGVSPGGGYYSTVPGVKEFGDGTAIPNLTAALMNGTGGSIWKEDTTGINAYNGVNYPVLYFQDPSFVPGSSFNVTVVQPEIGGTISADKASGAFAEKVTFTATPATGYLFDYFTVNSANTTNNNILLSENITVSVVYRELRELDFAFEDTTDKPYTLSATKTGVVKEDGVWTAVQDVPVVTGDKVYENDVIRYTATIKEGATPENVNQVYSGSFSYRTAYLPGTASGTANPITLVNSLISSSDGVLVTATPSIVAKDWSQIADTSWYNADDPQESYEITTAAQLAGVAKLINDSVTTFSGTTLTLMNDISLEDPENAEVTRLWVAGGSSATRAFKGTFDGNGKTIKDIKMNRTSGNYSGIFGYVDEAIVKDLTVDGAINAYSYTGAIAGYANNSTISNCVNKALIAGAYSNTGGVVGYLNGTTIVEKCKNEAAITTTGTNTTSTQYYGGVVGYANTNSTIKDCMNTGNVTAGYSIGGIVGYMNSASVSDSQNTGTITSLYSGSNYGVGGVVGHVTVAASVISNCSNYGDIVMTSLTTTKNASNAGGIVGFANTGVTVTSCFNTGNLTSQSGSTGGIVGQATGSKFSNCYNRGDITTETGNSGGVLGRLQAVATFDNIYTTGKVTRTGTSGSIGIVAGYVYQTTSILTNVHYLDGIEGNPTVANGFTTAGHANATSTAQTADSLKALAPTLGDGFIAASINDGFPILAWQKSIGESGSGDLDGDGYVTLAEVINLIRYISGNIAATPEQMAVVDMDGDGYLSMIDVVLMIKKIIGY